MSDRTDAEILQELTELRGKVTDEDLHESGRYFHDCSFRDLTRCSHGDAGNFIEEADGKAIALLWQLWRSGSLANAMTRIEQLERDLTAEKALADERSDTAYLNGARAGWNAANSKDPDKAMGAIETAYLKSRGLSCANQKKS